MQTHRIGSRNRDPADGKKSRKIYQIIPIRGEGQRHGATLGCQHLEKGLELPGNFYRRAQCDIGNRRLLGEACVGEDLFYRRRGRGRVPKCKEGHPAEQHQHDHNYQPDSDLPHPPDSQLAYPCPIGLAPIDDRVAQYASTLSPNREKEGWEAGW